MSDTDRKELYNSAVSFLNDPKISGASLAKKLEFLQSKGLTEQEIAQALNESNGGVPRSRAVVEPTIQYEALPPPIPNRDWKDYLIMATSAAGLFYGMYEVTRRYVIPNLLPESKTKLEQDKSEVEDHFKKVDLLLNAIEQEQNDFRNKERDKLDELDATISELRETIIQTKRMREKLEDDLRMLKHEMADLQNSIDNFAHSSTNKTEFERLTNEIASLKRLIKGSEGALNEIPVNKKDGSASPSRNPLYGGVPGADAVLSASEILAKANLLGKNLDPTTPDAQNLIPEWQKPVAKEAKIPEWQTAMQEAENNTFD